MNGRKLAVLFLGLSAIFASAQLPPPAGPNWIPGYRIRMPLKVVGDETVWKSGTDWIVASIPVNGWCKPDGSDLQVQGESGQARPTQIISCDPDGNVILQFQREGESRDYWVYVGGTVSKATQAPVGQALTLEVRPFEGNNLESWADVLKQIQTTPQIQGNAIVSQITHLGNPFRPGQVGSFTAIYRGFLKIENPGTYLFSSSSDDASFIFLNKQLVFSQTGKRTPPGNTVPEWHEMTLPAGLVPIEFYQSVGSVNTRGMGRVIWKTPDQKKWASIPQKAFVQAPIAEVTNVEGLSLPVSIFTWGMEDALISAVTNAYLVRFQAHGNVTNPNDLRWNFGDGSTAVGASVNHIYFEKGDYTVTLQTGSLAARQVINVYEPPVNSSPLSLGVISHVLGTMNLAGWNPTQLNRAFDFVLASDQPDRWKLQQSLAENLLLNKETDGARRMLIYDARLEAMAQQGHAEDAVKMKDQLFTEAGNSSALKVQAARTIARIQWKYLRNFKDASALYQEAIEKNRRVRLPALRRAAIEWGDMYLEADDMAHAEEQYRLASTLGGDEYESTGQMQAIQRGALLRVAEQQLKAGNVRQSRNLLDRIEIEQPEQKLEGVFRFLRAEVDRQSGRYPEAIKNYEVLLKLPQWSGYRDQALGGVAQCYYHLGEMTKATKIFNALKSSYPEYFEEEKLGKLLEVAMTTPAPTPPPGPTATPPSAPAGYAMPLGGNEISAALTNLTPVDALGIRGNYALQSYSDVPVNAQLQQAIDTLEPGKRYWLEYWYRDQRSDVAGGQAYTDNLLTVRDQAAQHDGKQRILMDRTFGQWRKVGVLVESAQYPQMDLAINIAHMTGSVQWDGIRLLPVNDREIDALDNFLQDNLTQ